MMPAGTKAGATTPTRPAWLRPARNAVLGACLLLAGFAAGLLVGRLPARDPAAPDLGPAPHYALLNQMGRTVSSDQFAGKPQIVAFLDPYCTTYCPLIAAHLIGFERMLAQSGQQDRVEVVAFNLAPQEAGPASMRAFLRQYGWDPADPHWQFLTGSPAQIRKVVTHGFHVAYRRVTGGEPASGVEPAASGEPQLAVANPLAARATAGFDVTHNDAIELVDARGRVRKIYDDADVVSGRRLWNDLQPLLDAGAADGRRL